MAPESPLPRTARRPAVRPLVAPSLAERAAAVAGVTGVAGVAASGNAALVANSVDAEAFERRAKAAIEARSTASGAPRAAVRASVILGIDPGTRVVGWGAIELTASGPRLLGAGVVRAGVGDLPVRLGTIRRELDRLIALYRPIVVAVEEAFAHKNMQSALRIGEARGVVLSCASAASVAVHQYPPAAAKKALVGNGAAHKSQVAAMVARRLELKEAPKPLDASDALALALTHLLRGMPRQPLG
ncbi:MAG TPA: crossover junction endodeoxyribonuclease RuvC [Planctomycetota bacterium]|nr:crossover junction endodeoxyribonuclease RuvC [Planctomycetota bacterium]